MKGIYNHFTFDIPVQITGISDDETYLFVKDDSEGSIQTGVPIDKVKYDIRLEDIFEIIKQVSLFLFSNKNLSNVKKLKIMLNLEKILKELK